MLDKLTAQQWLDKILLCPQPNDLLQQDLVETATDQINVGTDKYIGKAFYHAYEYKHTFRNMSREQRLLIHNEFISNGLKLDGVSDKHWTIIMRITNKKYESYTEEQLINELFN